MLRKKIEYAPIFFTVFADEKTQVLTEDLTVDGQVVAYAAWRWLCHCQDLRVPFHRICLGFRRRTRKGPKSYSLTVTVPVRATGLPGTGNLHILVKLSDQGVYLTRVTHSQTRIPAGISRHIHQVVFH